MDGLAFAAAVGTALAVAAGAAATAGAAVTTGPVATLDSHGVVTEGSGAAPTGLDGLTPCDGVAVAVDGGVLDVGPLGPVSVLGCAPVVGTVSAHEAATAAGLDLQGTEQWGAAFVCRVDGRPAVDEEVRRADGSVGTEACLRTPSQGAYWALWTSTDGSTWVYATRGVASLDVDPGDVVGLAFVTSDQPEPPRISPAQALAGEAPAGWVAEGSLTANAILPPDASPPVDASVEGVDADGSTGVVALVGLGLAAGLLALAGLRARARRP